MPYGPMHQCVLGFVNHVLHLSLGLQKPFVSATEPFVMDTANKDKINDLINASRHFIPSSWGSYPLPLSDIAKFKVEDFKNFGFYYGAVIFRPPLVIRNLNLLWKKLQIVLEIVFDPSPTRQDVEELQNSAAMVHALFCRIFLVADIYLRCIKPTVHVLLYLSEMVQDCGPLTLVSQFSMERVVGESGARVHNRYRP